MHTNEIPRECLIFFYIYLYLCYITARVLANVFKLLQVREVGRG